MTIADDIAGDWEFIDGIEDVTHTDSAGTATTEVKAARRDLNYREISLGGPAGLLPTDVAWELWAETLPSITPAQGDTITDSDSGVWTILSVQASIQLGATVIKWRAVCRKQV